MSSSARCRPALAIVVAMTLVPMLSACASSSSRSSSSRAASSGQVPAKNATVRISLDYSANVDYLGIYAAISNGYFAQEGITPQIIPYANTPAEP